MTPRASYKQMNKELSWHHILSPTQPGISKCVFEDTTSFAEIRSIDDEHSGKRLQGNNDLNSDIALRTDLHTAK